MGLALPLPMCGTRKSKSAAVRRPRGGGGFGDLGVAVSPEGTPGGGAGVEGTLQSVARAAQKSAQAPRPALEPSATLRIAGAHASGIDGERGRVVGARRTRLSGPCLKSSLFRSNPPRDK